MIPRYPIPKPVSSHHGSSYAILATLVRDTAEAEPGPPRPYQPRAAGVRDALAGARGPRTRDRAAVAAVSWLYVRAV